MTANDSRRTETESDTDTQFDRSAADTAGGGGPQERGSDGPDRTGPEADTEAAARAEVLAEENRRLRTEYARARKAEYRRIAYGLAAVGLLGFLGGAVFPDGREILFAFGFTGLFGGVLTLYLSPTRVVAADVGERVYAAMAANDAALATQLGIDEQRVYVPGDGKPAHLYLPQNSEYELPEPEEGPLVVADRRRGLFLEATGAFLFEEFERALTGDLATVPDALATQVVDGAVEQFELAASVDADIDATDGRATVRIAGAAFGDLDRFDHPLASFLAVGFAAGLDRPVTLEVDEADEYADWLVTCRWSSDESTREADEEASGTAGRDSVETE